MLRLDTQDKNSLDMLQDSYTVSSRVKNMTHNSQNLSIKTFLKKGVNTKKCNPTILLI